MLIWMSECIRLRDRSAINTLCGLGKIRGVFDGALEEVLFGFFYIIRENLMNIL